VSERGVSDDKITVLPNGADPAAFDPRLDSAPIRARYQLGNRTVIGFVGILRPWHGLELLLEAFSRLAPRERNLHLLMVGDGPSEAALKSQVASLGLDCCVTFTGRVGHTAIREHIAAMDVAVSPRATFYASPMKILEYMAMQVAVVAPRMPNIEDICEHGADSLLFEPESAASLADCLTRLVGDAETARHLGLAGRCKIESRLNWTRNAGIVIERGLACLSMPGHVPSLSHV
jgi:glycosyltransferase involved in cell wall biosynthesis